MIITIKYQEYQNILSLKPSGQLNKYKELLINKYRIFFLTVLE